MEFNGAAVQTYNPGGVLDLNNVIINNTGGGVNLFLHDMHIASTGSLNLMNGKLNTSTWKVILKNPDPNSLTGGTSANFVQGTLQRSLNGLANAYNFPIGHSVKGYQRMEVEFTTPTLIPDLTVSFATYPAVPNGPVVMIALTLITVHCQFWIMVIGRCYHRRMEHPAITPCVYTR